MRKKLLLLLAVVSVSFQITSCTSSKSEDETEVIENADVDKIEADESLSAEGTTEDPSMQAALGENPADLESLDAATAEQPATDSGAAPELPTDVAAAPTVDEMSLDDTPPPADTTAAAPSDLPPPVTNEVTPEPQAAATETAATPALESSGTNAAAEAPAKPADTLKKIALTAPYQTPAGWVNTVYVARPGETLKDISQKIFASDKTKELKKIAENKYLKWRSVRPGDKIYYVSPNRPDDSAKTLLYFEDMGMVPETYVAKKGDNLRKIAKKILGYDKAYIEMWTSNPVESKDKLQEGEVLKYWASASGVAGNVAANPTPNPAQNGNANLIDANQAAQMMPPPPDQNMPAPPPQDMSAPPQDTAALPPPPMPDAPPPADMMPPPPADTASLPPPPPPPSEAVPPPPPVEEVAAAPTKKAPAQEDGAVAEEGAEGEGLDNDTMMSLGAVGLLTAALAFALIHRKKKKAAEMAAAMNETHVGS